MKVFCVTRFVVVVECLFTAFRRKNTLKYKIHVFLELPVVVFFQKGARLCPAIYVIRHAGVTDK